VRDQQQRSLVAAQPVLEPEHGIEIQVIRRLVEQQQVRAAHERLREVEPHAPAAGEAIDGLRLLYVAKAEAREQRRRAGTRAVAADRLEALVKEREVVPAVACIGRFSSGERPLDVAELPVAVEHVLDRRHRRRRRFLRDVRERPARGQLDLARIRHELAADRGEEARLPAAVRPDEAHLLARVDREFRLYEKTPRAAR
jgi:hypothetical protein